MGLVDWFVFLFLTGLLIVGIRVTPLMWRHETTYWDRMPSWWAWGEGTFRAWVRSMPFSGVVIGVANLSFLLWQISGDAKADRLVRFEVPMMILGFLLIGLLIIQVTIFFYSWPKRFIAPHLRGEPSLVQSGWRGRAHGHR